jgi:hypothetical protein
VKPRAAYPAVLVAQIMPGLLKGRAHFDAGLFGFR